MCLQILQGIIDAATAQRVVAVNGVVGVGSRQSHVAGGGGVREVDVAPVDSTDGTIQHHRAGAWATHRGDTYVTKNGCIVSCTWVILLKVYFAQ